MTQPGEIVVIVNPMSGPRASDPAARGRRRAGLAREVLVASGRPGRVVLTEAHGHAREVARQAVSDAAPLVMAWGGDGTVNEVGTVLAFGTTPLGIVPGGSGNGLARALGLASDPAKALRQALAGTSRRIDAGELGGRLFFNVAGLGFDAHVAAIFNRPGSRRGFSRYLTTSLVELFRYRAQRCSVRLDDRTIERDALMVVFANGTQYGNGALVAPHARLDDGLIDLVVVETRSPLANVIRARHLFDGSIERRAGVVTARIARASVDNGSSSLAIHVDGETLVLDAPIELRVHHHALTVMAPADARSP